MVARINQGMPRRAKPMTHERDVLQWLRSFDKTAQPETAVKYKAAADEIERLRRARLEDGLRIDALNLEVSQLREKLAMVHVMICGANADLSKTCRGEDNDVDSAYSKIAVAIRLAT